MLRSAKTAATVLLGAAILTSGAALPATAQTVQQRFGGRAPRTCADQTAPKRGAIKAAEATRYFICKAERISGSNLYLVENVKLQVGGPTPYNRSLGAFEAVDVRSPLYPIRGSLVEYQCRDLIRSHSGPPSTSCLVYDHPKATGYCYKTTFGDWSCYMNDRSVSSSSREAGAPK